MYLALDTPVQKQVTIALAHFPDQDEVRVDRRVSARRVDACGSTLEAAAKWETRALRGA